MSQNDNFIYLTFSLTLLLLGTALAQQFFSYSFQHIVQSSIVVTLFISVWGIDTQATIFRRNLILPVTIIFVAFFSYWIDSAGHDYFHLFLLLIFFIFTALKTAKQVLFTGEIDGNKILGSICLYLLLGLIWAILYTLLQITFNDAFSNLNNAREWFILFPDFIYFSFVTLTTLGFGDISPTQPVARFLVYFQAIVGQFYIAVLVATLVGSRMTNKITPHD